MKQIIIFFFLLIFTNCDKKEVSKKNNFYNYKHLTLTETEVNTSVHDIYRLTHVKLVDSLLIVSSLTDQKIISIFNEEGVFVNSFGSFGRGPNDITVGIPKFYDALAINEDIYLSLFDINTISLDLVNLTKSRELNESQIYNTIELPNNFFPIITSYYINDDLIIAYYNDVDTNVMDGKTGIVLYNLKSNRYKFVNLPEFEFKESIINDGISLQIAMQSINAWYSDLNTSKSKIVLVHELSSNVQIFDITKDSVFKSNEFMFGGEVNNSRFDYKNFKEGSDLSRRCLFMQATDDFIYIIVNKDNLESAEYGDENRELIKLDYEGNILVKYEFPDNLKIEFFTVDEKNSLFYGIDVSKDKLYKLKSE